MRSASISTRLWLTYVLLIFLVLIAALAGIVFAFQRSPLLYRQIFLRMDMVSNLLTDRLAYAIESNWDPTIQLFFKEAELLDVRIAILDANGRVVFRTGGYELSQLPEIKDPVGAAERSLDQVLTFSDNQQTDWFYQVSEINQDLYLLAAAERPAVAIGTLFEDELVKPLVRAGLYSLLGAFILGWLMAKWITRPLKQIAMLAQKIAIGRYEQVPVEGPREVQKLAEVINDMSHKVENSMKSQQDFVANVSHEIKTPLTSIQGFSQAISDETIQSKEDIQHASEVILAETGRLNLLVNDLLTLAKLDAGTMTMQYERLELNQLVRNLVERFRYELEKADKQVIVNLGNPIYLQADGARLAQVFSNLLDNAIKFSPPGSKIHLETHQEGEFALLSVTDNGPGIAPEDLNRIYERFYQVDKSRRGGTGRGVGLGLAIARQIIQAHNGEIQATSQLGVGSTFMVKLPIEDAHRKTRSD